MNVCPNFTVRYCIVSFIDGRVAAFDVQRTRAYLLLLNAEVFSPKRYEKIETYRICFNNPELYVRRYHQFRKTIFRDFKASRITLGEYKTSAKSVLLHKKKSVLLSFRILLYSNIFFCILNTLRPIYFK